MWIFFLFPAEENEFNGADNTNHSEQADKAKNDVSQNPVKGAFVGYADDAPVGQTLQKVNPIFAHDKFHYYPSFSLCGLFFPGWGNILIPFRRYFFASSPGFAFVITFFSLRDYGTNSANYADNPWNFCNVEWCNEEESSGNE